MSANATEQLLVKVDEWERAFNENGEVTEDAKITISEAFTSPDAPLLFPKVVSKTLREAAEPEYVISPLFSLVRLGRARSFEFPAVNAIQADEIAETQEYPEQALAFINQREGKVSKKGVKIAFSEEVIADSMWDIVGLHVRAAGRAMARLKEQIALGRLRDAADDNVAFDNDDNAFPSTSGLGDDGQPNGSYTWEDLIDQAAILMAKDKVPTDFIVHPLAWAIFLKGTFLDFRTVSAVGNLRLGSKEGVYSSTAPLGINTIVTPFVRFVPGDDDTAAKTDVYMIDRNEIGAYMVRDDLSVDDWNDQTRDIRLLKMKERYDFVVYGDAEGVSLAKNVSVVKSHEVQLTKDVS
jgi:hypothetical protein